MHPLTHLAGDDQLQSIVDPLALYTWIVDDSAMKSSFTLSAIAMALISACLPPPAGRGNNGNSSGGGNASTGAADISPDRCGNISTSDVGRKTYAFLKASADLDRASIGLETSVANACRKMAQELGVDTSGDTRTVCSRAAVELDANLKVSTRQEKRLVTRHTPPVCTTELDFAAGITAECEAKAVVDTKVSCEGSCSGTCSGTCNGTCASGNAGGVCNGACNGTCQGKCSGSCNGYANVDASAECKASAEVRASVNTTCTEPKVEIVEQDVTIVDDSKFRKAQAAINAGMPTILAAGKRAEYVARAAVLWTRTLGSLLNSSGKLIADLGAASICVGGELATALAASTQIEARFSVSIEVSAQLSASAGTN
jgi:hypothetical protein